MRTPAKAFLVLTGGFLCVISLFAGLTYYSTFGYLRDHYFRLLEIRALSMAKIELGEDSWSTFREIHELSNLSSDRLSDEEDYFFPLVDSASFSDEAKRLGLPPDFFRTIVDDGKASFNSGHRFYQGILYSGKKGEYVVVVSAYDQFEANLMEQLGKTLIVALSLSFIFASLIAFFYARMIFNPISAITDRVKQISSENLHLRLDLRYWNTEVNEMARTFNDMLTRIETSFDTQNNFISNASHELRTPLTAIIGEADVALVKKRNPEEYELALRAILKEAERLEKKTDALLFLAQTGFDGKVLPFDSVRIDQLIWDVKETVEKINGMGRIVVRTDLLPENPDKLTVQGNEQLLHLALSNLLGNACKYSDNKKVYVSLGASEDVVFIVIKDQGIGIPEHELMYIYNPFFRASNTKPYEGYGIGMPLTRNIVKMHHGQLKVSSALAVGTIVQVELPSVRTSVR